MNDPESIADRLFDPVEHLVRTGIATGIDTDVAAEGVQSRRDAPDMQIVDLDDTRDGRDRPADLVEAGVLSKMVVESTHDLGPRLSRQEAR